MAQTQRRVKSARVAQANTPETDAMPKVMHLVSGVSDSGESWTVKLMAADPLSAMDEVAVMDEAEFMRLERMPDETAAVHE